MNSLSSENPTTPHPPSRSCIRSLLYHSWKMDSLNIRNIRIEKANALKKHRQLQKFASLFRVLEICLVLALVSRFIIHVPFAVKNSSEYFKGLSVILVSPCFVFILGNAIVITLFAKSGQFSGQDPSGKNSGTDLYQEFVEKSEKSQAIHHYPRPGSATKTRSPVQAKELGLKYAASHDITVEKVITEDISATMPSKKYDRSQSVNCRRPNCNKSGHDLRRSATDVCGRIVHSGEGSVEDSYPADNMSKEEFRCTIEAFIARQKRFHREEENSVFLGKFGQL